MKALIYTGIEELTYKDIDPPQAAYGEQLVEVKAVGICGSDMHAFKGHDDRRPAPLILGHEVAGALENGHRVTVNPLVTCMQCDYCISGRTNLCPQRQIISMPPRQGGFAEYITIPERNLVTVPDHVSFEQAALAEPISVGWHALELAKTLSHKSISESRILVIGGGAIGLVCALVSAHFGATEILIAETNLSRHEILLSAGNFRVFNPASNNDPLDNDIDIVIDAFGGTATQSYSTESICPGGVIINVGLAGGQVGLDVRKMTLQDIKFAGPYTYTSNDFVDTTQAMFSGQLGSLDWFKCSPLSEGYEQFLALSQGKVSAPKVMLVPNE